MIDTAYFLALFYVSLRFTAYFASVAVFFPTGTPSRFKGILALMVSFGILSSIDYGTINEITSNYYIVIFAVNEIMTGIILGIITNTIFEMMKMAGAWMDIHAGFGMVSLLDPVSGTQSSLLGNLSYIISTAIFFIVDGHNVVLKALVDSFNTLPIGSSIISQSSMNAVMRVIFDYFTIGIRIAIPLVIIILITDLCLGLITRTVPTIPIMIFGLPIKNVLSMTTYLILLPVMFKAVSEAIYNLPTIFESLIKLVTSAAPLALIFADDDKTEEATPKRKGEARKKGQIARSKDLSVAVTMVTATFLVATCSGTLATYLKKILIYFLSFPGMDKFGELNLQSVFKTGVVNGGKAAIPFMAGILLAGIIANLFQTRFLFTTKPLKFDLSKLKPKNPLKKLMFSKRSMLNFGKNILVIGIIAYIAYTFIKDNYPKIVSIHNIYLPSLGYELLNLVVAIMKKISIVLFIIGAVDYYLQIKMHKKDMKMTKQEVKDEYKQAEGDPKIKSKIKQKQREIGMRRMMQSVADATVVITNPTHLAIALKYEDDGSMEAPKVVGKGADYLAFKIKQIAKEHDIPVVENKPLARLMYQKVEVDQYIPQDLYQGVAEILAVVMKLKK